MNTKSDTKNELLFDEIAVINRIIKAIESILSSPFRKFLMGKYKTVLLEKELLDYHIALDAKTRYLAVLENEQSNVK